MFDRVQARSLRANKSLKTKSTSFVSCGPTQNPGRLRDFGRDFLCLRFKSTTLGRRFYFNQEGKLLHIETESVPMHSNGAGRDNATKSKKVWSHSRPESTHATIPKKPFIRRTCLSVSTELHCSAFEHASYSQTGCCEGSFASKLVQSDWQWGVRLGLSWPLLVRTQELPVHVAKWRQAHRLRHQAVHHLCQPVRLWLRPVNRRGHLDPPPPPRRKKIVSRYFTFPHSELGPSRPAAVEQAKSLSPIRQRTYSRISLSRQKCACNRRTWSQLRTWTWWFRCRL